MAEMMNYINGSELSVNIRNDGSSGKLNHMVIGHSFVFNCLMLQFV